MKSQIESNYQRQVCPVCKSDNIGKIFYVAHEVNNILVKKHEQEFCQCLNCKRIFMYYDFAWRVDRHAIRRDIKKLQAMLRKN